LKAYNFLVDGSLALTIVSTTSVERSAPKIGDRPIVLGDKLCPLYETEDSSRWESSKESHPGEKSVQKARIRPVKRELLVVTKPRPDVPRTGHLGTE